uniref:Aspartyl/asparaginy/proline hydroxylase domain-containing protein n=1 Tax=Romanomermis culicivorax TaxID=13658 RepID=A0A915IT92_ROMCU
MFQVLNLADVTDDLYMLCAERLVDRLQFRGWIKKSIKIQEATLSKFPQNVTLLKQYGLTFLILGQNERAEKIFKQVLKRDPENGHTLALYGFVLKISSENRLEESIDFLYKGVKSRDPQAQDARFYFHLGDALQRLDRTSEAYDVYEQGVRKGFFISKYQRSLYNVPNLKSRPWWSYAETTYEKYLKMFENEWKIIRDEALSLLDENRSQFKLEDERLTNKGDWRQFTLFVKGRKVAENCLRAPRTCSLASKIRPAATCTRGQIKFSLMRPGTKVWPHCGPTNCRLRAHLGLVVPSSSASAGRHSPRIRVANETRTWKSGRFIIFDDSFEHEVWYDDNNDNDNENSDQNLAPKFRLVLIVDFWHPDLTPEQISSLDPI